MAIRTVGVRLVADIGDYLGKMREAGRAAKDLGAELDKTAKAGNLDRVADGALRAGAAITAALGGVVFVGAQFEQRMSAVAAATRASGDELDALSEAALEAGARTKYSASEAADAITELAKAGLSTADILSGGLDGALDLAAAGEIEVAEAAEVASAAMVQFGLKGRDVVHVADLLAAGAGKALGGVSDMAYALKQAGLVASQTGLSIEETTGTLAAFASAGLLGSDAGTSLRTMLLRLAAPTGEAAELMEELGIEAFNSRGEFVGMVEWAGRLQTGLAHLTDEQRQAALATIFGQDAIRAASIAYEQGAVGIAEWIAKVNDQGYAAEQAGILTDNLRGDIEALTGSLETLFITSGEGANSGLRSLVRMTEGLVDAIAGLPAPVLNAGTVIGGLIGLSALGFAGFVKFRSATAEMAAELAKIGPAGQRAATGLRAAASAASIAGAALTGALIAGQLVDEMIKDEINPQIDAMTVGLRNWASTSQLTGEAARVLGQDFSELDRAITILARSPDWATGLLGTLESFGAQLGFIDIENMREQVEGLDQAMARMVQSGDLETAAAIWDRLAKGFEANGISIDRLKGLLPQYIAALEVADAEAEELASSTEHVTRAQLAAVDAGETLIDVWKELHGAAKTADEEMLDAVEAVKAVTEAFQENTPTVVGNTEAALRNRLALAEVAEQAYEAADALIANGGSAEDAAALIEDFKRQAIDAAIAAGGNADEVQRLADQLFRIPKNVTSTVTVNYQMSAAAQGIGGLAAFSVMREGGVVEHAQAGLLREAGIYGARSPAMYAFAEPGTGGEAFIPRFGDRARSLAILEHAAGWYGAMVVPRGMWYGRGGGAGSGGTVTHYTFGDINITVPVDRLEQLRTVEDFTQFIDNLRNSRRRGVVVDR